MIAPRRVPTSIALAQGRALAFDRPLVMAILNATPDSFSDGGRLPRGAALVAHVENLVRAGADILDIGGESTRPGHEAVPAQEEAQRVLGVLSVLRPAFPGIPISVDTRKAEVAYQALRAGADFVNDVSALADPAMAGVVREAGCPVVLMRHRDLGRDVLADAHAEVQRAIDRAVASGIRRKNILVDPGLGFGDPPGADVAANLALLDGCASLDAALPVVVGASRKRFVGTLSGHTSPMQRDDASAALAVRAVQAGAQVVRVHNVAATVAAMRRAGLLS